MRSTLRVKVRNFEENEPSSITLKGNGFRLRFYKSDCVKNDKYLFSLVRYIHQNPIKAGIVEKISDYKWSSFEAYIKGNSTLTNVNFVFQTLAPYKKDATQKFEELHELIDDEEYMPIDKKRKTEAQIRREIIEYLDGEEPNQIATLAKSDRNRILATLKEKGLSIRQIERATGVSRGVIAKC